MAEKLAVEVELQGADQFQLGLKQIEQGLSDCGTAVRNFAQSFAAVGVVAGTVAIAAAASALIKFTKAVEDTNKTLTQLQKVSGVSLENLSAMQQVFAAGGTAINKFAVEFEKLSEKIATATQTKQIREADKDWVKWANDVDVVRQKFDNLATGGGEVFSVLTTLNTKVEALLESLGKAGSSQQQWLKLADIFKNLSSDIERAQLGKALGLSPETIATLSQGSVALQQLQAEAAQLGLTLTTRNQQALQQMAQGWNQFTTLLSAAFQKIAAAAAPAFAQIIGIAKTALSGIVQDFETLPLDQAVANLGNRLGPAFNSMMSILSPILIQMGNALGVAFVGALEASIKSALQGVWVNLGTELQTNLQILLENIRRFTETPIKRQFPPSSGGGEGMAGGGLIGGRGTGTSDSNLAWLSRGEFVVPARAVAQPGVLTFLEALRRNGGNFSRVLDGMGRFALGGLVPRSILAFAGGGLVAGMSNVTIQFPGVPEISGLRASSNTVDELRHAAALAQVRSGGRKPSRYS